MPIYQISKQSLTALTETKFDSEGLYERKDLQRLLQQNIDVLGEGLMVVTEEFGEWTDSNRRIDLLCLDTDANLVVVELKRTDDGAYMDLQAIRYAAMVSAMTFQQMVEAHSRYRNPAQPDFESAQAAILEFLGWSAPEEDKFGSDVRIILASADFNKELTTSVIWLNEAGLDIRCIRLKPYKMADSTVLMDVQQIIPLPEAVDFQTQIGEKKRAERQHRTERHDLRYTFWSDLLNYARTKTDLHANRKPTQDGWISGGIGRAGFSLLYSARQQDSQVELWIGFGAGRDDDNLRAFNGLLAHKTEIEQVFEEPLEWQELPERTGCRIRKVVQGGYRFPRETWPTIHEQLVDAMIRLDRALRPHVHALKV